MKRVEHITLSALLMVSVSCGWFIASPASTRAQEAQPAASAVDPPLRDLWTGYLPARHLREWDIAGPLTTPLVPPGARLDLTRSPATGWRSYEAFNNRFEVLDAAGAPAFRTSGPANFIYTRTTVKNETDRRASLAIDTTSPVRLWLNGAPIPALNAGGTYDLDLKTGANEIVIEYRHELVPVDTTVVLTGADAPAITLVAPTPTLSMPDRKTLVLKMPDTTAPATDLVVDRVSTVLPPKQWTVRPDSGLTVDVSDWPDGPYAFHIRSSRATGGVAISGRVQWYKGDAAADAQAVMTATAPAPKIPLPYAAWLKQRLTAAMDADLTTEARSDRLAPILMEYQAAAQGLETATGFVRLAYEDPIDGSTQYCRVYLPGDYDRKDSWPTVVSLHGFNPANPDYAQWWSADATYHPSADRYGVIWIEPHGRGNAQYLGIGEQDVLTCLSLAQQTLKIDRDRTYLTGESMGGSGTWLIASRHPDLFAAIAPNFGGFEFRVAPSYGADLSQARADWPTEAFSLETQSSFQSAESLLHVPVFVNHGGSDPSMPVAYSRHAVNLLQRWGYDVRYWEHPAGKHSNLDQYDTVIPWLLQHRRVNSPTQLRLRSRDLAGASSHWLSVEEAERPLALIRVEARLDMPGLLRLRTSNVAAMVLTPPKDFYDSARRLKIVWNDVTTPVTPDAQGRLHLGHTDQGLAKRPDMEGGLSSVITTPFMLVVGTQSSDPAMTRAIADKADAFAGLWREWQREPVRRKRDTEVTAADKAQYSLILLGGPGENLVTKAWAQTLPFEVRPDRIAVAGEAFATKDAALQLIYPSPAAAGRYAFVVAPTSPAGMYFWNAGGLWQRPFGASFIPLDWTIQDGLRVDMPRGVTAERALVASGVFDAHWQGRSDLVFPGDPAVRADGTFRSAETKDVRLADYAGAYEIFPGFAATIAEADGRLTVTLPGVASVTLVPERKDEFGARESNAAYVFTRGTTGQVCAVEVFSGSPKVTAKRLGACGA